MKKVIAFLSFVLITSCSSTNKIGDNSKVLYEVLTKQNDGGANIQFYEILSESNEISMLFNDDNLKKKVTEEDVVKSNFVILNMGEKNTGGYSIDVVKVEETPTKIIITVKENTPNPNKMVTQEITYPYTVVRINSKKEISIVSL